MKTINIPASYFYSVVLQFATEQGMRYSNKREKKKAIDNYVKIAIWYN